LQILESGQEKSLPFKDDFLGYSGWTKTIGKAELTSIGLHIKTGEGTTGSVFLDGTRGWVNYAFSATVNWLKGSNLSLLARYSDDSNYLSCNFSTDRVRIESKIKGETSVLSEEKRALDFPVESMIFGIRTEGNVIECLIDNRIVLVHNNEQNLLSSGGIGFRNWDAISGNGVVTVQKVNVEREWDKRSVMSKVNPDAIRSIPYFMNQFNQDIGWVNKWGEVLFENGSMLLKSNEQTTGSLAILNGTFDDADFNFRVEGSLMRGSNIVLLVKYIDEENYIALNLNNKYVRLEESIEGTRRIIEEIVAPTVFMAGENSNLMVSINGTQIDGYIDNKKVISGLTSGKLMNGSIGIKSWDPIVNNSELVIKSVYVEKK
jgi:hypothetical protein